MALLQSYEFWVGGGLIAFILILLRAKVPGTVGRMLDDKAAAIQHELDEAHRLHAEAEALLASIKTQRDETEKQAGVMMAEAEAAATRYAAEARIKLDEQIKRRQQLAERKIASAEAAATAEVKAAAAELAANVAEQILAARLASAKEDPMVDRAVEQLAGKFQ